MANQQPTQMDLEAALRHYRAHPELIIVEPDAAVYRDYDSSQATTRNNSRSNSLPDLREKSPWSSASSSRKSSGTPFLREKASSETLDEPPDGGLNAWMQAVMGHLMYINTWGYITSYGIFQQYELSTLGISQMNVSWVGSLQIFLLFFVGTFSGRAFDAGLFRFVYPIGVALQVLGVFATSFSTQYWHFVLAQGFCTGLGAGLQYTPTMSLVASYFSKRKFFAISLASCGSATGGVIFPLIVKELLPRIGFGWTLRTLGFIQLGLGLVTIAFLKPRAIARKAESSPIVEWRAFREWTYVLYCAGIFFNFWALYFITDYLTQYAETVLKLGTDTGFTVLMVFSGIGVVGRLLPAYVADTYLGALNTVTPAVFACAALVFFWLAVDSPATLYVFVCVAGIAISSVYALATAALASLTADPARIGVRMGMAFTIGSFAALSGPVIGGQLVSTAGGAFTYAQIWAGVSLAVAGCFFTAARVTRTGWKLCVKC